MRVELSLTYVFLFHSTSFRDTKDPDHGRKGSLYDAIQARKASDFLPFPFLLKIPRFAIAEGPSLPGRS